MTYGKKYTATIASRDNETLQADIYVKGYEGDVSELTLVWEKPITIEYDMDDGVFKPLKMSACTVSVLTDEPLLDLYTGTLNSVQLKVYRDGTLIWFGFLTPNVYSSEYDTCQDQLDLEFVDPLSAMENVKFKKFDDEFFATFEEYIQEALSCVGADSDITEISEMPTDLASVGCMQRNYIDETDDEDDGAMTWQEVMESILRYMNKTAYVYGNTFYIYDAADKDRIDDPKDLATIGIAEGNGSISLGEVYNKVTVVANSNPEDSAFDEDIFDDSNYEMFTTSKAFKNWFGDWDSTYQMYKSTYVYDEENYTHMLRLFTYNGKWEVTGENEHTGEYNDSSYTNYSGSAIEWVAQYKNEDGVPSSISWEKDVFMRCPGNTDAQLTESKADCYVRYTSDAMSVMKGGYLVLNMAYEYATIGKYRQAEDVNSGKSVKDLYIDHTIGDTVDDEWTIKLKIGDKYFNGSEWTTTESTFKVKHAWNADDALVGTEVSLDNTVTWQMSMEDSEDGVAIPLGDEAHFGAVEIIIYGPTFLGAPYERESQEQGYEDIVSAIEYVHIKSLSLQWKLIDNNIVGLTEDTDDDITYTGGIDTDNVKDGDDVEFTTNTYNSHQASYSYAITQSGTSYDFYEPTTLPEQTCISRLVNYYSQARMQYQNTINDKKGAHVSPVDNITIPAFTGKTFTIGSVTFNLAEDSADVTLLEIS